MGEIVTPAGEFSPFFRAYPLPMMLFARDDLRILDVNAAAVRQYGWTRAEFLCIGVLDIVAPEEVAAIRLRVARDVPVGQETRIWRHRHRDGRPMDVEVTVSDLHLEGRTNIPVVDRFAPGSRDPQREGVAARDQVDRVDL